MDIYFRPLMVAGRCSHAACSVTIDRQTLDVDLSLICIKTADAIAETDAGQVDEIH